MGSKIFWAFLPITRQFENYCKHEVNKYEFEILEFYQVEFPDHFSKQAETYAKNRPQYPPELYSWLVSLCKEKNLAWDVATGNGQAALALAQHFEKVVATEPSSDQLAQAPENQRVEFRCEPAENSSLGDKSTDLITVATAAHWFDLPAFYQEVRRVSKPDSILAIWSYGGCEMDGKVGELLHEFAFDFLEKYWPPQTRLNWVDKYEMLHFPFQEIPHQPFSIHLDWNIDHLFGYIRSWSGVKEFQRIEGHDPLAEREEAFRKTWDNEPMREVSWPLYSKVARL